MTIMTSDTSSRRPLASLTAVSLAAMLIMAGCAAGGEETQSPEGTEPPPAEAGEVVLTFMNQSRGQEAALTQLADQYADENGIEIIIDSPGPAEYLQRLQARAQSGDMPDVYSSFNATEMAPFYRAGWAMDLSNELNAGWSESFSPAILEMSTFEDGNNLEVDAGIYTVHWETQSYGLLINPAVTGFDSANPPASIEEFISGIQNAPTDSGELSIAASLIPQFVQFLASNWLTDEEIAATFNGDLSWESDGWRNAFQVLTELKDAGVIANDAIPGGQDANPNVESAFFTSQVGAIFSAAPVVAVGRATNPDFQDYFSLGVPATDGPLEPRSPGVPGKGAVINPQGDHPEVALDFVKWLTQPEQQAVFAEVAGILPTNPELLSSGDVSGQLAGFAAGVESLQVMSEAMTSDVTRAIEAESQRLVLGEVTVNDVLASIQAAQDRSAS